MAAVELPASRHLKPAQQGSYTGLCGLYSIINGLRLAMHPVRPLTTHEAKQLFYAGLAELRASQRLTKTIERGMPERTWMRLTGLLVARAQVLTEVQLKRSFLLRDLDVSRFDLAARRIERSIAKGAPVLILAWGAYNHCTVVKGVTETRLCLFDSASFLWLQKRSCVLYQRSSDARHMLSKRSAVSLQAKR